MNFSAETKRVLASNYGNRFGGVLKTKGFNTQYTERYKKEAENLLNQIDAVGGNGKISRATAVHFIEKSAWWLTHPSGPVREPGYANRIEGPETALSLKYGANTFKITQALLKCIKIIRKFLKKNLANPQLSEESLENLKNSLVVAISGSVTRFDGSSYNQYRIKGDEMVFGAHAINVKEFIDCFFGMVPVDSFIWKHLKAKQKDQKEIQAILKFSKNMKKYYEAMLSSENRATQVENAILTLQLADNRLRTIKEPDSKAIFSALTDAIYMNKGDIKHLGSLLTSLFSQQRAAITKKQAAKTIPKINSQLRDLLRSAGFEVSESEKTDR